ncbi:MAG: DNA polymerase III subunit epsilon, partial [Lachnospiraceae bacterium]|nr:DNA polymerase III subunit epsilon [Lachnospiraceae bacterium]
MDKGKRVDAYVSDYVVFDLETTGTSTRKDKIIEIAALRVANHQVVEEFASLVNPGVEIPYHATQVNHITDDMVEEAPGIEGVLPEFLDFCG